MSKSSQLISDFESLRKPFEQASDAWGNLECVLITWPEDMPVPDPSGRFHFVPIGFGTRLDTHETRYRPPRAGMIVKRRRCLQFGADPSQVHDPDDELECYDRFTALARRGTEMLDQLPKGAISEATMKWNGEMRWLLMLHEIKEPEHQIYKYWQYGLIKDVYLASAFCLNYLLALPAATQANKQKRGDPKWKKARRRMLELLDRDKLPTSLREAQRRLRFDDFTLSTVRRGAEKSEALRNHFPDAFNDENGMLLDELSQTVARQFGKLPSNTQQALENEWRNGNKQKALNVVKVMTKDPGAGTTGDVPLIENADQDCNID